MSCGDVSACSQRDLVRSKAALLIWCVPAALVIVGALWPAARALLWLPSFVVMGSACVFNAKRCGRLHCHITGPLFLLAALATLLDALDLPTIAWPWVLAASFAGTALGYALEYLRGAYTAAK